MLLIALLRSCKLHQLHFLKLVLADDSTDIASVRSGFAAKARCIGAQRNRQNIAVQSFATKQVRYGYLGRRSEPQVMPFAAKQIFRELRQIASTIQTGRVDQKRRQNFLITML